MPGTLQNTSKNFRSFKCKGSVGKNEKKKERRNST